MPPGENRNIDPTELAAIQEPVPLKVIELSLRLCQGSGQEAIRATLRELEPAFSRALTPGTAVVVDYASCDFVHAPTRTEALKLFIARFGASAKVWAFDVDRVMSVGAASCQN